VPLTEALGAGRVASPGIAFMLGVTIAKFLAPAARQQAPSAVPAKTLGKAVQGDERLAEFVLVCYRVAAAVDAQ
jgi:hypothetical protein